MSKMQTLQQALSASSGKSADGKRVKAPSPSPASKDDRAADANRQPTRVGKVNVSAWLDPDFKSGLRLVQVRKGPKATVQDILAEALNDLFTKYDVPTVRQD